ncbi:zinc finger HIT domain-containing protein 3 [Hylaeus volcanicus]|uniref:zinc finger HIT domain-containing protein 3 n=1 Tax=Hylaeus volcanicus TaxID=313075 RepID=UPI0023B871C5|nr:zinc finger HIT domain-containing protein 3 [Hylaeus volcanicus]
MEKVCCVCKRTECSYKCPVCREPYCSIACCKVHKESNCEPPKPQQSEATKVNTIKYEFPTEDTVPIEKLQQLHLSKELKNCLRNPHVRNIMRSILTDKNPTKAIALAMTEPIFVEMADACLKVVEPSVDDQPF